MNFNPSTNKLFWIDLEMTGLDPLKDKVLEIAVIITDFDFNELESYECVIHQPEDVIANSNEWAKKTFSESGLFNRVQGSNTDENEVQRKLLLTVGKYFTEPAILAGNSIHQDRLFIRNYFPEFEKKLHYRMLDVSSFKIIMQEKYGVEFKKIGSHKALDDIKESMAELRFYLEKSNVKP